MGIITEDMRRIVEQQRLGYVATVCADGTPNLSPKGTTLVWDEDHLIFADIRSPGTIRNLRLNPVVEVNVVDPLSRKGFRFKGTAVILEEGPNLAAKIDFFRDRGVQSPIRRVVMIEVTRALPVTSPAYDSGATEAEVRARWSAFYARTPEQSESDAPHD